MFSLTPPWVGLATLIYVPVLRQYRYGFGSGEANCPSHKRDLIGTVGSAVCWINHKTTPFDNLYRGMEKESQKISSERTRNRRGK